MHSVVDLTDSPHPNASFAAVTSGAAEHDKPHGHSLSQSQPKLGPQAAAAKQAGVKRKLPDSFRAGAPAKPTQNNQKRSQEPVKRKHAAAPVHRLPATRVIPQAHSVDQAAAHTLEKAPSDAALHDQSVLDSSQPTNGIVIEPSVEMLSNTAVKPASQAKRRLPESLAAPNKPGPKGQAVGTKAGPTMLSLKAGPSEHDTKAALRAALEGLQMSGGRELDVPAGRMAVPLMRHQRLALAWMLHRERSAANPRGGILADDQGLGKTISTIALIVTNQRGDDIADEGYEDLASDSEQEDVQVVANAEAAAQTAAEAADATASAPVSANGCNRHTADSLSPYLADHQPTASSSNLDDGCEAQSKAASSGIIPPSAAYTHSRTFTQSSSHKPGEQASARQPPAQEELGNKHKLPEGGTLIICPTAVLNQWSRELSAKVAPPAGMTMYMYHGKQRGVDPKQLSRYACVLTTYTTMAMEAASKEDLKQGNSISQPGELPDSDGEDITAAPPGGSSKGKKKKLAGPLFQIYWWRVVMDESQAIKNAGTLVAHASHQLQAGRRWCLSGTPIQNSVDDLYSCFRFLRYNPYCKRAAFKTMLKDPLQDDPLKGAQLLQVCLKPVLLRRTKSSTIEGEPVVKLPPREQLLVRKAFSLSEQKFYDQVQAESMQKLKELEQTGGSYVNMLWLLLRLRQACNHPWLVHGTAARYGGPGATSPSKALGSPAGKVSQSQLTAAKKLAGPLCQQLLQTLLQEPNVCAQCGDIPEDAVVSACHHVFCQQCITMQVGALGGKDAESSFSCPTCSQPLSAAQVFTGPALRKARGEAEGVQAGLGEGASRGEGGWQSSSKVEHLLELLRAMQHRGATGKPPAASSVGGASGNPLGGRSKSDMRLAKVLGGSSRRPVPSTTSTVTQEKVIVFSQWTSMLDLIEVALKQEKFVFRRLDGSMSMANRDQAIIDFQEKPGVNILIVSLKAAALGLNLVAANHVVLLDLWWNPTIEEQAIDRAHRIGQTRTVHVTRITIAGTVEERILALQDSKRKIVSAAFGDGGSQQASRLTKEDLHYLFSGHR